MGKQVYFNFNHSDEQGLIELIESDEPWMCLAVKTKPYKWRPASKRGDGKLFACPSRLVSLMDSLESIEATAGRALQWERSQPVDGTLRVGADRIWLDTNRRPTDHGVRKVFNALVRHITTTSPKIIGDGGMPIYIGAHLLDELESRRLAAAWPNGDRPELVPNPRVTP